MPAHEWIAAACVVGWLIANVFAFTLGVVLAALIFERERNVP